MKFAPEARQLSHEVQSAVVLHDAPSGHIFTVVPHQNQLSVSISVSPKCPEKYASRAVCIQVGFCPQMVFGLDDQVVVRRYRCLVFDGFVVKLRPL